MPCVCMCVCVRGDQNSLRSSQGEDCFTLREIVSECEEGDTCGGFVDFSSLKIF